MNAIRLTPGTYKAEQELQVSVFQGKMRKEDRTVQAGQTFEVPRHINGFYSAVTYHPEYDAEPKFSRID